MTAPDADDAGLVALSDAGLIRALRQSAPIFHNNDDAFARTLVNAADRIEAQRREIEELRREVAEAKEWNRLRALDIVELGQLAGKTLYARSEGFAAGLEAGAEMVEVICERFGKDCEDPKLFLMLSAGIASALSERAREERGKP